MVPVKQSNPHCTSLWNWERLKSLSSFLQNNNNESLELKLLKFGLESMEDNKSILIEKIKKIVIG